MSLTWRRSRITGAGLVAAQYDLTLERQTTMDNILFIPGIANPVSEINSLLFGQGQPGGSWIPSLSSAMIAANTFGSGVEDVLDLSGNNNPFSQATPSSRSAWFREPKTGRRNLVPVSSETINWALNGSVTFGSYVDGPFVGTQARQVYGMTDATTDINGVDNLRALIVGTNTIAAQTSVAFTRSVYLRRITPGSHNASLRILGGVTSTIASATVTHTAWTRLSVTSTGVSTVDIRTVLGGGGGADGVLIAGDTIETGAAPTAFQKVASPFDITEDNQRDCYGLRFGGINDFYQRAIDFSGTDKVTLFVAMRRRSDAARGTVLELTSSIDSNNGAFHLTAPNAASATFGFESKGTTLRDAVITQAMGNPRIITAIGDISGDLTSIQVDNGTPTINTGDQGSGSFSNAVLYLGSREGLSLSLNGDIFGVIAVGGLVPASIAARVRTLLSNTTPTVIV